MLYISSNAKPSRRVPLILSCFGNVLGIGNPISNTGDTNAEIDRQILISAHRVSLPRIVMLPGATSGMDWDNKIQLSLQSRTVRWQKRLFWYKNRDVPTSKARIDVQVPLRRLLEEPQKHFNSQFH
jgi:hypothetical protein